MTTPTEEKKVDYKLHNSGDKTGVCMWCGEPYEEHEDSRPSGAAVPKVPCIGLKSGYFKREENKQNASLAPPTTTGDWEKKINKLLDEKFPYVDQWDINRQHAVAGVMADFIRTELASQKEQILKNSKKATHYQIVFYKNNETVEKTPVLALQKTEEI